MIEMSHLEALGRYEEHKTRLEKLLLPFTQYSVSQLRHIHFVASVEVGPEHAPVMKEPFAKPNGRVVLQVVGQGKTISFHLGRTISWLMGDRWRSRAVPIFKFIYLCICLGLLIISGNLLYLGALEVFEQFTHKGDRVGAFSAILFLTLALAVFDLGKTILEEEVLMHKDIFRHSAVRRTITRFIAAILIAVSIEGLLLLFKGSLGQTEVLYPAIGVLACSIGFLIALGLYVHLGTRSETLPHVQTQNK